MTEVPSAKRRALLQEVAERILAVPAACSSAPVLRVAIDGVDGAGKTVFADELEEAIEALGRPTIRASVDGFHHPASVRYRLGRTSPRGFYLDSYNYPELKRLLLDPLSPGGTGRYRVATFDHRSDLPVRVPEERAAPGAVLIFDGIFLHRPELRAYWDFSVFLEVAFAISIPRGAQRGEGSADPQAEANRRYVQGQAIYLRACKPKRYATMTIDNEDLASPCTVS